MATTQPRLAQISPVSGWRLWLTIGCLSCGLLLSSLETTIIATSLISISSSLGGYDKANWVVTGYLITYTGLLLLFARLSDLVGRKPIFCLSLAWFVVSSLACGLAQSMEQLIVFRASQGMGGAGLYSMAMLVIMEVTPVRFIGVSSGLMGSIFATSSVLGPVLGGAITSHSTWRWVFYLNLPPGTACLVLAILFFPSNDGPLLVNRRTLTYIDYPGTTLFLLGSTLLIFALEQGGIVYAWKSAAIIASLVIATASMTAFAIWEWQISGSIRPLSLPVLPIFPAHLVRQRVLGSAILTAFITGIPFMVTIVFLPQRLQLQNGLSPAEAGTRVLTLLVLVATGGGLGGVIASRRNISWPLLMTSLALQILGLGLMSTLPSSEQVSTSQYAYQAILGLGFGLSLSSLVIIARLEVEAADVAVTVAIITQFRVLGGLIGIGVAQAALSSQLLAALKQTLSAEKISALLQSIDALSSFTPAEVDATIQSFGQAFNMQTKVMLAISAVAIVVALGAWKRNPQDFAECEERRVRGLMEQGATHTAQL